MIDELTSIWKRLLERPSICVHDNFFDLGGDPCLAVKLFNEIARVFGRELPPWMIFQAPTVAALAFLLEQPGPPQSSPLLALKAGVERPPIYVAHGIGGSVMDLFHLVRCLEVPNPILGMQSQDNGGVSERLESIEDMAQFYLDAIKKVQPVGPYFFIGYSLGGLVAFETARRLTQAGDRVGLLTMVDSYPHCKRLPLQQRVRLATSRIGRGVSKFFRLPAQSRYVLSQKPIGTGAYHPQASFTAAMQRVRDSAYSALKTYQPRMYNGRINFVRAEVSTAFPDDPFPVWAHLTAELEVDTVPGDHQSILTTHYKTLGLVLTRHLKAALSQQW